MLPLSKIISEAGISFNKYFKLIVVPIEMRDRSGKEITEGIFNFVGKFFSKNPDSFLRFKRILDLLFEEEHLP